MNAPPIDACCASLPAAALLLLGHLRACQDLRVVRGGERIWLFWPAEEDEVWRRVLPIRDAVLYRRDGDQWFRVGRHLPANEVPNPHGSRPLASVLVPAAINAQPIDALSAARATVVVVRDTTRRDATALRISARQLATWADRATSYQLGRLQAACQGETILLRGPSLPPVASGERYYGRTILIPLGYRAEPLLPEEVLREAFGLAVDEIAALTESGLTVIANSAFGPLTRAGLRLASRGGS